ncbi:FHA domain-containing protein [Segatella oris]|uniref:Uncharacterized protein n=1 Tax=Segatella oris C735 TaxID=563008 RepID=D7NAI8_9BACT|nr:hypothetical protein [Segatella oris]EFI49293.1 hypothetical protein HMPREF0665_00005 [Segatella oris C735]
MGIHLTFKGSIQDTPDNGITVGRNKGHDITKFVDGNIIAIYEDSNGCLSLLFNVSSTNSRYVNSILNMNDSLHFVQNLKMCESSFHATMQDKMFVNGNKDL